MSADAKLQELNLQLPPAPAPQGVYKPLVISGNMAYVSGHGPLKPDGTMFVGRVGSEVDQQAGYDAARQSGGPSPGRGPVRTWPKEPIHRIRPTGESGGSLLSLSYPSPMDYMRYATEGLSPVHQST
jgi:hypothetical protein